MESGGTVIMVEVPEQEKKEPPSGRARGPGVGLTGPTLLDRPVALISIIVATVFLAETLVMVVLSWLPPLSEGVQALIDSGLLVAILLPMLLVLVYRPLRQRLVRRHQEVAELVRSEQRFRDIAENANEWIWEVDVEGRYTYCSGAIERILGYTPEEVLQLCFYDLFHPDDRESLKAAALEVFGSKQPFRSFLNRNVHKNGRSVWLATSGVPILGDDGELLGYRGADTVKLDEAAFIDPLTGLVNRMGFQMLAEHQLKIAARGGMAVTLLFVDLDGFKAINDDLGHFEGDRALVDFASILRQSVRDSDIVARFGGDEFVVLLAGTDAPDADEVVVDKIRGDLPRLTAAQGRPYTLRFSVGVVRMPSDRPIALRELLHLADRAMYADKRDRRALHGDRASG